jgi:hypothetical protein
MVAFVCNPVHEGMSPCLRLWVSSLIRTNSNE